MKIKKLNTNTINYLPYQEPIKKGAIITDWYFYMRFYKYKREDK
tara:strand:+ start:2413 stop:2544 length:132 start_codon:yes stop_codon:yes gene_type:complete